ncbi:MAG: AMP-binding protein [Tetrasphaera sp.]|nr:AMP-binding protein [Tetrasphaera sp.]
MTTLPQLRYATVADLLLARRDDPDTIDRPALKFEDSVWTWRELLDEVAVRAAWLTSWRPDDEDENPWHVGLLTENTPEFLFLTLGAAMSGASIVGLNSTRRGAELAADIEGTNCRVIVTDAASRGLLDGLDVAGLGVETVWTSETEAYAAELAPHRSAPLEASPEAMDPRRRLLLLFTSGSTGRPKAVVCSTGRWATISQLNPIVFTPEDVAYNAMPLFHGNALMAALAPCLFTGASFAMRRKFSASGFLPDIQKFGATFFNYVGRSLAYILGQPERPEERDNVLRFGFGTEASAHDRAEFQRRFGCMIFEAYGSSEGVINIVPTPDSPPHALGVPTGGVVVDICAPDGSVCPTAEFDANGKMTNADAAIGEIVGRQAVVRFEGYYNNPDATLDKARDGDYWSGDLGYKDEQGYLWFAGRTADWLRVDSENVATAPIERILVRFPGVHIAAVYPVPDPRTGDRVMAALQMTEDFDPVAFADFLRAQTDLGTKSAPALVRVSTDLPVTATRKINKPQLRRDRWEASDPVFERQGDGSYAVLSPGRVAELRAQFELNDRAELLDR